MHSLPTVAFVTSSSQQEWRAWLCVVFMQVQGLACSQQSLYPWGSCCSAHSLWPQWQYGAMQLHQVGAILAAISKSSVVRCVKYGVPRHVGEWTSRWINREIRSGVVGQTSVGVHAPLTDAGVTTIGCR